MPLFQKILNKFNGLHFPQEYLCLAKEKFESGLHVYMMDKSRIVKELTDDHLFVGYSPLVFLFHAKKSDSVTHSIFPNDLDLIFTQERLNLNEYYSQKDVLASLQLKIFKVIEMEDEMVFFYKGIKGTHHFISGFHQAMIALKNRIYNRKPGNVFLEGNLYKQVQIAYSIPRIISTITVGNNGKINLFPTDLHGDVGGKVYVSSLRLGGKACKQVEEAGKVLISQIHYQDYKHAYSLGKNHMQDMKSPDHFGFGRNLSKIYQLPYLPSALSYREIELVNYFDAGMHRIFLFKIIARERLSDEPATLAHIHNCYATWRHNNRLGGNYLLR